MKVLVLDCGGMIGNATARALAERGLSVVRASRHGWAMSAKRPTHRSPAAMASPRSTLACRLP